MSVVMTKGYVRILFSIIWGEKLLDHVLKGLSTNLASYIGTFVCLIWSSKGIKRKFCEFMKIGIFYYVCQYRIE